MRQVWEVEETLSLLEVLFPEVNTNFVFESLELVETGLENENS